MKLPFSSPRTSRSPSGYARVISSPSARTRSAICDSSKAILRRDRPARRGSDVVAFTEISQHRPAGPVGCRVTAAHSGNPDDLTIRQHDGPPRPIGTRDAGVTEEPLHTPCRPRPCGVHPVPRTPATHREPPFRRQRCRPRIGVRDTLDAPKAPPRCDAHRIEQLLVVGQRARAPPTKEDRPACQLRLAATGQLHPPAARSEEHTSELQSPCNL